MRPTIRSVAILFAAAAFAGCSASHSSEDENSDDALTSITARSRTLTFEGAVYVDKDASDATILKEARKQSQTAFGALLAVEVAVQSREVRDIDPATFKKREVKVVDTATEGSRPKTKLEVRYTYTDEAIVPVKLARRTSLPLALLTPGYDEGERLKRVVEECTKNDSEVREDVDAGLAWYDFNPSKASCKKAITDEQKAIDADREKLTDPRHEVPLSQVSRQYLPATMSLTAAETAQGGTYPEYDQLFSAGVEPGKLSIGMIAGRLNHEHAKAADDDGYYEWMDSLGVIFEANPGFKLTKIDPDVDLSEVTVGGHRISGLKFSDFIQWTVYDRGYPEGVTTAAQKKELRTKIGDKLDNKWVTFELPVRVTLGAAAPKDFTIALNTLFGADEDPAPHKRAVRKSDVFIYNGHSYIGYGPLDPSIFRSSDFPPTYQLFFIDGCVSYNYYNEGYFQLKAGGTEKLDTITNGLEAPEYDSGAAQGRLVAKLITGTASYKTLLTAAKSTDPMRVVDGETDNKYKPATTPLRVEAR